MKSSDIVAKHRALYRMESELKINLKDAAGYDKKMEHISGFIVCCSEEIDRESQLPNPNAFYMSQLRRKKNQYEDLYNQCKDLLDTIYLDNLPDSAEDAEFRKTIQAAEKRHRDKRRGPDSQP